MYSTEVPQKHRFHPSHKGATQLDLHPKFWIKTKLARQQWGLPECMTLKDHQILDNHTLHCNEGKKPEWCSISFLWMGEKNIWENTLVLMTNNDWNLMNFGTGQQPNKCYVDRVPFMITTCTKRGEQPKSHSTDGMIFDPNDSPQLETVTGVTRQTS